MKPGSKQIQDYSLPTFLSTSQVSVSAREDVPPFGPVIPDPPIFTDVRNRI